VNGVTPFDIGSLQATPAIELKSGSPGEVNGKGRAHTFSARTGLLRLAPRRWMTARRPSEPGCCPPSALLKTSVTRHAEYGLLLMVADLRRFAEPNRGAADRSHPKVRSAR
jgi:hypothetical protein